MCAILMLVTCGADGCPVLCHVLQLCYINRMAAGSRFRKLTSLWRDDSPVRPSSFLERLFVLVYMADACDGPASVPPNSPRPAGRGRANLFAWSTLGAAGGGSEGKPG